MLVWLPLTIDQFIDQDPPMNYSSLTTVKKLSQLIIPESYSSNSTMPIICFVCLLHTDAQSSATCTSPAPFSCLRGGHSSLLFRCQIRPTPSYPHLPRYKRHPFAAQAHDYPRPMHRACGKRCAICPGLVLFCRRNNKHPSQVLQCLKFIMA